MVLFSAGSKWAILIMVTFVCMSGSVHRSGTMPRILVFSKTSGYTHSAIPYGIKAIMKLGKEKGFMVDTSTNAQDITDERLKNYQAVVFNNTTGNVLNSIQQAAFERFIQAGGGFAGIHSAADTEYDWPWYGHLMGAFFDSHPLNPGIRKATVEVADNTHASMASLPPRWERSDEWYNYKSFYPGINVLASLDEDTYEGGTNGSAHPISWYHAYDGGRAFYTGMGHTPESYSDPLFLAHLAGGIMYAIGDGKAPDYSKARSKPAPEQNRFTKKVLAGNLNNPMELAVAPDGRVFFTELFGNVFMYDTRPGKKQLVHKLPVTNTGGTGLIGIALDPHFSSNHFIYLYYAPAGQQEEPLYFNLSRFTLNSNNTLNISSEKILLKVPVQKSSGSHHGGSLAFDRDGNLYLSTGDSSSPFPSNGYAPLDEQPGKEHVSFDSQRSAANTNDFKGKILRIHPEPDGTYTIPEGNLFPKGTEKTRPEIYVMGVRNPYRIAINPVTSVLYWGEPGPDAGKDSIQGPKGYDEFNQARRAGNYGWPYFAGNNTAYAKWDFAKQTAGPLFDAQSPVNNSPNNTGLNRLPPASPALIWYPYTASQEFPELGLGARCAIAGDFYLYHATGAPDRFPEYYNGAWFIADWMRNWVMAVHFDEQERLRSIEPFMPLNGDFRRPIDMTFGSNGIMYMLEYGSVYGQANEDAELVQIGYNTGNRKPLAKAAIYDSTAMAAVNKTVYLTSDKKSLPPLKEITGVPPLRVSLTGKGSMDQDDDDELSYRWLFDGKNSALTPDASFTYTKPGNYKAVLTVRDRAGLTASDTVQVKVGNTRPDVNITHSTNRSFFWNDQPFQYDVQVSDHENRKISTAAVKVFYRYDAQPLTLETASAKPEAAGAGPGKNLLISSDCRSCHQMNKTAVGPSFTAISQRYKSKAGAADKLAKKIISGGGGNWSKEYMMSAHPQLNLQDAREIVKYILSVTAEKKTVPDRNIFIPAKGSLVVQEHKDEPKGVYTITASYTDKGSNTAAPLQGTDKVVLRSASVKAAFADVHAGFERYRDDLSEGKNKSYLLFRDIDLTDIRNLVYTYAAGNTSGEIEVRIDSRAGPVISSTAYASTGGWDTWKELAAEPVQLLNGKHDLYIIAVKKGRPTAPIIKLKTVRFNHR